MSGLTAWQVRVTLLREAGSTATPRLDAVGAMVSRLPATADVATSAPGVARGTVLPVPTFSQMVHQGHYPQWGGGGQAWCSPTSLAMVLRYYRALPPKKQTAWAGDHGARVVDHLARIEEEIFWPYIAPYAATSIAEHFMETGRDVLIVAVTPGSPAEVAQAQASGEDVVTYVDGDTVSEVVSPPSENVASATGRGSRNPASSTHVWPLCCQIRTPPV